MSKKKTNKEFLLELSKVNPNITPLEEYKGANTEIECMCTKCNHIWKTTPDRIVRRRVGCPKCNKGVLKTNDEFLEELKEINIGIEPLEEYINAKTKIKFLCKTCGHIWKATPGNILNGTSCPKCGQIKCHKSQTKSDKRFKEELKQINENIYTNDIYVNNRTDMKFKCKVCDTEWISKPLRVLIKNKVSCPKCSIELIASKLRKNEEEFLDELNQVHPYIEPMEEYKNIDTKIKFRCKVCNNILETTPYRILKLKNGCTYCSGRAKITSRMFIKELQKINPTLEMVDINQNMTDKRKIRCKICGNIFYAWKGNLIHKKSGCPNLCTKPKASSVPEQDLMLEIQSLIKNKLTNGRYFSSNNEKYQLDGYFESLGIGIEYDGLYWHSNDKYKQYNKKIFFKDLDIDVIFIREDEWVVHKDKLINKLKNILNINPIIKTNNYIKISKSIAYTFLEENNLYYNEVDQRFIGFYSNRKLISVIGYKYINNKIFISNYGILMNNNTKSLSIFIKYIKENYPESAIYAKVDNRLSLTQNEYTDNNFEIYLELEPDFVYFKNINNVFKSKKDLPYDKYYNAGYTIYKLE